MAKRVRVPDLMAMKQRGERITMLTAYDATMASLLERAGVDVLLVGDSLGMVLLGYETTLPVTMAELLHHTRAVARGAGRCLVVADMPFMSYQVSLQQAVKNAGRLVKDGGAAAVKLEGGRPVVERIKRIQTVGIPVMGHLGLTPQAVHALGGFRRQAQSKASADSLVEDGKRLQEAGVFAVVLESIPDEVAQEVTETLDVPTIGIGAGPCCDGQVLVTNDALGLFEGVVPPFVKQYASLAETVVQAGKAYVADVRAGRFPETGKGEKKDKERFGG